MREAADLDQIGHVRLAGPAAQGAQQMRDLFGGRLIDDRRLDGRIGVRQPVAHAPQLRPGDRGKTEPDGFGHVERRLPDDQEEVLRRVARALIPKEIVV